MLRPRDFTCPIRQTDRIYLPRGKSTKGLQIYKSTNPGLSNRACLYTTRKIDAAEKILNEKTICLK